MKKLFLLLLTVVIISCHNGDKSITKLEPTLEVYNNGIAEKLKEFMAKTVNHKYKNTDHTLLYLMRYNEGETILRFYYTTPFECNDFVGAGKFDGQMIYLYSNLKKNEYESLLKLEKPEMDCNSIVDLTEIDLPFQMEYKLENGTVVEPDHNNTGILKLGLNTFVRDIVVSWEEGDSKLNKHTAMIVNRIDTSVDLIELLNNEKENTNASRKNWAVSKWIKTPFDDKEVVKFISNNLIAGKENLKVDKELKIMIKELKVTGNYLRYYYKEKEGHLTDLDFYLVAVKEKKIYKFEISRY